MTTERVYDAFILNSGPSAPNANLPTITVNSEREAAATPKPSADATNFRLWEVAGAAHTPVISLDQFKALYIRDMGFFPGASCTYPFGIQPIPWGVSRYDVPIRSAVEQVSTWAATGHPAVSAPRIDRVPGGLARDSFGNVTGGIRLPEVVVPIVRHVGRNGPDPFFCATLYGYDSFNGEPAGVPGPDDLWTEPASPTELYGNHGQYVSKICEGDQGRGERWLRPAGRCEDLQGRSGTIRRRRISRLLIMAEIDGLGTLTEGVAAVAPARSPSRPARARTHHAPTSTSSYVIVPTDRPRRKSSGCLSRAVAMKRR